MTVLLISPSCVDKDLPSWSRFHSPRCRRRASYAIRRRSSRCTRSILRSSIWKDRGRKSLKVPLCSIPGVCYAADFAIASIVRMQSRKVARARASKIRLTFRSCRSWRNALSSTSLGRRQALTFYLRSVLKKKKERKEKEKRNREKNERSRHETRARDVYDSRKAAHAAQDAFEIRRVYSGRICFLSLSLFLFLSLFR